MSEIVQTAYEGEIITYNEISNTWSWGGTAYQHPSLTGAKQAIDRAHGKASDKEPAFKAVEAYCQPFLGYVFEDCTVTGKDVHGKGFWIKRKKQGRSKENSNSLFALTQANTDVIRLIQQLEEEKREIHKKQNELVAGMETFTDWLAKRDEAEAKGQTK